MQVVLRYPGEREKGLEARLDPLPLLGAPLVLVHEHDPQLHDPLPLLTKVPGFTYSNVRIDARR